MNQRNFANFPQLGTQLLVTITREGKAKTAYFFYSLPIPAKFCESQGVGSQILTDQFNKQTITHSSFLSILNPKALEKEHVWKHLCFTRRPRSLEAALPPAQWDERRFRRRAKCCYPSFWCVTHRSSTAMDLAPPAANKSGWAFAALGRRRTQWEVSVEINKEVQLDNLMDTKSIQGCKWKISPLPWITANQKSISKEESLHPHLMPKTFSSASVTGITWDKEMDFFF